MQKVIFNGKFMLKGEPRGVQRYTKEVISALDRIVKPEDDISVIVPKGNYNKEKYNNISLIEYGGNITSKF